jgi:hypothetical protein
LGTLAYFATFQSGFMLTNVARRANVLLLTGLFFMVFGVDGVFAQAPQRGQPPEQAPGYGAPQEQEEEQQPQQPQQSQEAEPFIHGISLAAGIAVYQGDFSRNPEHSFVKYIAGSGKLSLRAGLDHRLGQFDQYGVGADVVYNRLGGETTGGVGFDANSVAVDFYGDYELPYIRQGLFRVFVGVGPKIMISPSYKNFSRLSKEDAFEELGTRVIGSLKVGVTIFDRFRIGTRIASTDMLDGYEGFDSDSSTPDFISFLNFGYRFSLK